jgi:hypothetical protein
MAQQNAASLPQNPQTVQKKQVQEEDPLIDSRKKRFINDTLELA